MSRTELDLEDPQTVRALAQVGTTINRKYRIDARLGVGSLGAVFAATHRNGHRVALKMLHPELARIDDVRQRSLREGYLANRVVHRGVVRVTDDDTEAMAAPIWSWTCSSARRSRPCSKRRRAVSGTRDGELKVLDFGVARLLESASTTGAGQLWGTPAFMAPEQAGADRSLDHRCDLWAVGALLFRMLSGRDVHLASSDIRQLILAATERAVALVSVAPHLPSAVCEAVDKALRFERAERFQSAREMQSALRKVCEYERL